MRTKTVRIDKTKHKTQPFTVTELGRVDKVRAERYKTLRTASIGAVRACADFLKGGKTGVLDSGVKILLPGNRWRMGFLWRDGTIHFGDIQVVKSTTKSAKRK